jgi:hypothetical protein
VWESYLRTAERAAMMAGRYAHAKQFNRHRQQLSLLRTRLGRLVRDIGRKIAWRPFDKPDTASNVGGLRDTTRVESWS